MIKISGYLKNGSGEAISNVKISLKAIKTTQSVIEQTICEVVTDKLGSYEINVQPNNYEVTISAISSESLGIIKVYSDSSDGSLNDFLTAETESDITPEIIQKLNKIRDEIEQYSIDAKESCELALQSKNESEQFALNANESANNSNISEKNAEESAISAASAAKGAGDSAEQAKSEVKRIIDLNPILSVNNIKADSDGNVCIDSGFDDAPKDGKLYARNNGKWVEIVIENNNIVIESDDINFKIDDNFIKSAKNGLSVKLIGSEDSKPIINFIERMDYVDEKQIPVYSSFTPVYEKETNFIVDKVTKDDMSSEGYYNCNYTLLCRLVTNDIEFNLNINYSEYSDSESAMINASFFVEEQKEIISFNIKSITTIYNDKTDYLSTNCFVKASLDKGAYTRLSNIYGNNIFSSAYPDCKLEMKELRLRYSPNNNRTYLTDTARSDFIPIVMSTNGIFLTGHDYNFIHPYDSEYIIKVTTGSLVDSDDIAIEQNQSGITIKLVKKDTGEIVNLKELFNKLKETSSPNTNNDMYIMYPSLTISGDALNSDLYKSYFEVKEI